MSRETTDTKIALVAMFVLIVGALGTYGLPVIRAEVPPVVSESWSTWAMTKSLPKAMTQKESKWDVVKVDFDFMDVLVKIIPENKNNQAQKFSLTFILGLLVPVALVLTYVLLIIGILLLILQRRRLFSGVSFLSLLTGAYALAGTFYLGKAAVRSFETAVGRASEGFLGVVAKKFVQKIVIAPDKGLYALVALCALLFVVQMYRSVRLGKERHEPLSPGTGASA